MLSTIVVSCLLFSFICVICYLVFHKAKNNFFGGKTTSNMRKLPGPVSLPVIGGIWRVALLGYQNENYETYHALSQRYGKTMGFRGGIQSYLVTEEYETMKEILTSAHWTDRFPSNGMYNTHTLNQNLGLLFSNGISWKETRRFTTRTLGDNGIGDMKKSDSILKQEIEYFLSHIDVLLSKNHVLEVNDIFSIPILNINWCLIMGQRFNYNNKNLQALLKAIKKGAECEFGRHPVFNFPFLNRIPCFSPLTSFNVAFKGMYQQVYKLALERRSEDTLMKIESEYFIDKFLQKIDQEKNNSNTVFSDPQLLVTITDLLVAGTETTSNALSYGIMYMLLYPEVQLKVQAELDSIIGTQMLSVHHRTLLPYTRATALEIERIASVVPVLVRTSTCDTSIDGYHVPKGVMALMNTFHMHHDPEVWGDPENFRPERFLEENKESKDQKILSFGLGRRICVGQPIAKLTFFYFFASLLQKYSFQIPKYSSDISNIPISGITRSPRPFKAHLHLRSSH